MIGTSVALKMFFLPEIIIELLKVMDEQIKVIVFPTLLEVVHMLMLQEASVLMMGTLVALEILFGMYIV